MAFLVKSLTGLVDVGLGRDIQIVSEILQDVTAQDILALLTGPDPGEGVDALVRILRDVGPLVNTEVFELLATSPDPVFHAQDIIDGLQKGLAFQVDDPKVFLRTSVIDFGGFADFIGGFGSFYAGYGPADRAAFSAWLDACAPPSVGLTWNEAAALATPSGPTCGETFADLFERYREAFAADTHPNRVDDPVGRYLPVFAVTGVLTGDAITEWELARDAWLAADPIPFEPDFADIGVGYWGRTGELARMSRRLDRRFDDLVSEQFVALGPASWREALSASPAEPGFSPAVPLSSGVVSVGGWADPLRVTALDALGAQTTIALNRRDGVGGFTADVTRLLGATDEDLDRLYSLTDPSSSFNVSLATADGVWCSDWDAPPASDIDALFADGYQSPLLTTSRRLLRPRNDYPNVLTDAQIVGCTPGLGPPLP